MRRRRAWQGPGQRRHASAVAGFQDRACGDAISEYGFSIFRMISEFLGLSSSERSTSQPGTSQHGLDGQLQMLPITTQRLHQILAAKSPKSNFLNLGLGPSYVFLCCSPPRPPQCLSTRRSPPHPWTASSRSQPGGIFGARPMDSDESVRREATLLAKLRLHSCP